MIETYGELRSAISKLREVLDELPTDVAAKLREMQITGVKSDANSCPLAIYLTKVTNQEIAVDGRSAVILETYLPDSRVLLPSHAYNFVHDFDHGCYPDLVNSRQPTGGED